MREYGIGSQILAELGLTSIRLLTNNPRKITGLSGFGLEIVEQVSIEVSPNVENIGYLTVKRAKLGHRLHHQDLKDLTLARRRRGSAGARVDDGPAARPVRGRARPRRGATAADPRARAGRA